MIPPAPVSVIVELRAYYKVLSIDNVYLDERGGRSRILCFLKGNKLVRQSLDTGICSVQSCRTFAEKLTYIGKYNANKRTD